MWWLLWRSLTFACRRPIASKPCVGTDEASTASASMTSGVCAFSGLNAELWKLKLPTTTRERDNDCT